MSEASKKRAAPSPVVPSAPVHTEKKKAPEAKAPPPPPPDSSDESSSSSSSDPGGKPAAPSSIAKKPAPAAPKKTSTSVPVPTGPLKKPAAPPASGHKRKNETEEDGSEDGSEDESSQDDPADTLASVATKFAPPKSPVARAPAAAAGKASAAEDEEDPDSEEDPSDAPDEAEAAAEEKAEAATMARSAKLIKDLETLNAKKLKAVLDDLDVHNVLRRCFIKYEVRKLTPAGIEHYLDLRANHAKSPYRYSLKLRKHVIIHAIKSTEALNQERLTDTVLVATATKSGMWSLGPEAKRSDEYTEYAKAQYIAHVESGKAACYEKRRAEVLAQRASAEAEGRTDYMPDDPIVKATGGRLQLNKSYVQPLDEELPIDTFSCKLKRNRDWCIVYDFEWHAIVALTCAGMTPEELDKGEWLNEHTLSWFCKVPYMKFSMDGFASKASRVGRCPDGMVFLKMSEKPATAAKAAAATKAAATAGEDASGALAKPESAVPKTPSAKRRKKADKEADAKADAVALESEKKFADEEEKRVRAAIAKGVPSGPSLEKAAAFADLGEEEAEGDTVLTSGTAIGSSSAADVEMKTAPQVSSGSTVESTTAPASANPKTAIEELQADLIARCKSVSEILGRVKAIRPPPYVGDMSKPVDKMTYCCAAKVSLDSHIQLATDAGDAARLANLTVVDERLKKRCETARVTAPSSACYEIMAKPGINEALADPVSSFQILPVVLKVDETLTAIKYKPWLDAIYDTCTNAMWRLGELQEAAKSVGVLEDLVKKERGVQVVLQEKLQVEKARNKALEEKHDAAKKAASVAEAASANSKKELEARLQEAHTAIDSLKKELETEAGKQRTALEAAIKSTNGVKAELDASVETNAQLMQAMKKVNTERDNQRIRAEKAEAALKKMEEGAAAASKAPLAAKAELPPPTPASTKPEAPPKKSVDSNPLPAAHPPASATSGSSNSNKPPQIKKPAATQPIKPSTPFTPKTMQTEIAEFDDRLNQYGSNKGFKDEGDDAPLIPLPPISAAAAPSPVAAPVNGTSSLAHSSTDAGPLQAMKNALSGAAAGNSTVRPVIPVSSAPAPASSTVPPKQFDVNDHADYGDETPLDPSPF